MSTLARANGDGELRRPALGFHVEATYASDGAMTVRAAGELDAATGPILREVVQACCAHDGISRFALDVRELSFIDSTGLAALLYARDVVSNSAGELVLIGPSHAVEAFSP
jgi:anti-anti-sigma factor